MLFLLRGPQFENEFRVTGRVCEVKSYFYRTKLMWWDYTQRAFVLAGRTCLRRAMPPLEKSFERKVCRHRCFLRGRSNILHTTEIGFDAATEAIDGSRKT